MITFEQAIKILRKKKWDDYFWYVEKEDAWFFSWSKDKPSYIGIYVMKEDGRIRTPIKYHRDKAIKEGLIKKET